MATRTELNLQLAGVHLCCQGCVDAAEAAIMSVKGVHARCDMEKRTITLTARQTRGAKALNALAAAGFHGSSDNDQVTMKPVSTVPQGKIKRLEVSAIHNCCGPCWEAIKQAIATVDGVAGDTAQPRETTFEVTGDFEAAALVKALNAAGFSAQVKRPPVPAKAVRANETNARNA